MKYLVHAEFEINDPRFKEVVELLSKLDIFWSEEEVDDDGFQV